VHKPKALNERIIKKPFVVDVIDDAKKERLG
jgi:hypothetical protein